MNIQAVLFLEFGNVENYAFIRRRCEMISDDDKRSNSQITPEMLKGPPCYCHYCEFEDLWAHINGRDSWNLNPLVWAMDFEAVK